MHSAKAPTSIGKIIDSEIAVGSEHWSRLWLDLASADGSVFIYLGLTRSDHVQVFRGDGKMALTFGGINVERRN
jgi:hypothetical protein